MTAIMPRRDSDSLAVRRRLEQVLNDGALALLISVGHRTGLFEVMSSMAQARPETIARMAGLSPTYVSAWLAAMVAGGLVGHDPQHGTYALPDAYAGWLSRRGGDATLAVAAQWLPLLGSVEEDLLVSFVHGRELPRSAAVRFRALDWEQREVVVAGRLLDAVVGLVPGLETRLDEGIDVLEAGSGNGAVLRRLASRFPESRFLGMDRSPEAIATAVTATVTWPHANLRYQRGDASQIQLAAAFDLVLALDAIRAVSDPLPVLRSLAASLREGGTLLLRVPDLKGPARGRRASPLAVYGYALALARESGLQAGEGPGTALGEEQWIELLVRAGLVQPEVMRLPSDGFCLYLVARMAGRGHLRRESPDGQPPSGPPAPDIIGCT
jgi:SAM-dependent methyltransferase